MAMPRVVVYRLEGCATGLDGPYSRSPQGAGGGPTYHVTPGYQTTFFCSAISACRWHTTTGCTRRVSPMSRSTGTTCRSCGLCCPSLQFGQPRGDRQIRNVRRCWIFQGLRAPHLDHLDARSLAGGQRGSWKHQDSLHPASQAKIHRPRWGQWCSTAALKC